MASKRRPGRGSAPWKFAPLTLDQVGGFVDVLAGAYPMFIGDRSGTMGRFQEVLREGYPELIGCTDERERMVGGYALYTFVATLLGRGFPATGLGMVATALDRKKRRIALHIVRDFVERSRADHQAPISFLYPFRHDFYADMGWALIGQNRQYRFRPSSLPLYAERDQVEWVRELDWQALDRVHRRSVGAQGGLGLSRNEIRWEWTLRQASHIFLVGPADDPRGYLISRFVKPEGSNDHFRYRLEVLEMDWVGPEALRALLGFLSSQRDQVQEVVVSLPINLELEMILRDPVTPGASELPGSLTAGPTVAYGAMLRLEDPEAAFAGRPYAGTGSSKDRLTLRVTTSDPLREGAAISFQAELGGADGHPSRKAAAGSARLDCGLATLAAIWAAALPVSRAVELGLAKVDPESAVPTLDRLLWAPPPWIVEKF